MALRDLLRETEHSERELFNFLRLVLDSDPECIVLVDSKGRIIWLNKAYEAYLGVCRHEVQGKHVTEVIDNTRLHIVARTGVAEIGEIQKIKGRTAIVSRIPIFKNGRILGAIGKVIFKTSNEVSQLISKVSQLENEVNYYKRELSKKYRAKWTLDDIISCSRVMEDIKNLARKLASIDINILILGESGTGKELFAHAIHLESKRNNKPFVYINCAAVPENLMESELFGYESGAFTNAKSTGKAGKLEIANGGTVFLDEIGDMPLAMQAKILRFLQEGELEKLGSVKPVTVDVRVISATNRDIKKMVQEGTFRADLYYRLSGAVLEIPPLRERIEDIPVLAEHFLRKIAEKWAVPLKKLEQNTLDALKCYHWPGNIRELEHLLEKLYCMSEGDTIKIWDLPSYIFREQTHEKFQKCGLTLASKYSEGNYEALTEDDTLLSKIKNNTERKLLEKILEEVGGNKKKAAEVLGIHRTTLYLKLRKYNLL